MTGDRDLGPVLVTGAAGFLGAALVRRLRALSLHVTASDLGLAEAPCDLTDFAQVDRLIGSAAPKTLFHCGAVSGPMVLADQPLAIWQINAMGTAHVLEAARRHGVGRVVVCSTCDVYGDQTGVMEETTLPHPTSVYGASKVAAEAAMQGYIRQHELDAVALRLSWIYGPGRQTPTTLETILRAGAMAKDMGIDAAPDDVTHYLYIADAVEGLLCAGLAKMLPGRVYNITAGQGVPMRQVIEVCESLGRGSKITLLGKDPTPGPASYSNHRAALDLGFRASTSLEDGLRRYRDALLGKAAPLN